MVWGITQSPIGKYVPDAVGRTGSGGRRGCGAEDVQGCGAEDVQGCGARGSGWLGGSARGLGVPGAS